MYVLSFLTVKGIEKKKSTGKRYQPEYDDDDGYAWCCLDEKPNKKKTKKENMEERERRDEAEWKV